MSTFPRIALKRVLHEVNDPSPDGTEALFMLGKERGLVPRMSSEGSSEADSLVGYKRFRGGDLVMNKMQAWNGVFGTSPASGLVSPDYAVFRPSQPELTDVRFLNYLVRTPEMIEQFAGLSRGMGTGFNRLHPAQFLSISAPLPSLHEQRRIADFLDDQTTRIDQILRSRLAQAELVDEWRQSSLDDVFDAQAHRSIRLALVATLQSGITVDGRRVGDNLQSVPYLRVANVKAGWLDLGEVKEIEVTPEQARRHKLRPGDVLMTEGGDLDKLGRGTVWRGEVPHAIHQNHVFAVRVDPSQLLPEYLAFFSAASPARRYFETTGTRSTNLASTSATKVLDLPVPAATVGAQAAAVAALQELDADAGHLRARIRESVGLLQEFKRSLISAAVSGEFDVTTARGRGVPV